jgi:hypothetical protein
VVAVVMSRTHWLYTKASHTDLFFPAHEIALYNAGAWAHKGLTGSQLSVQSLAEAPSPTITDMLAVHMAATHFSLRWGSDTQHRSSSVLASHSQRSLRAKPKNLRSMTPRPPRSVGRHTPGQETRHFPLVQESAPNAN